MKYTSVFDGHVSVNFISRVRSGRYLLAFQLALMVGASLVFSPLGHCATDTPTVPVASPEGKALRVLSPTTARESELLTQAEKQKQTLWSKIKDAVLLKRPRLVPPHNTVVGGQALNFHGTLQTSSYLTASLYRAWQIGEGQANLIPNGPLFYLPGTHTRSIAFHLPLKSPKAFRLLAVTDLGEAQELITEPRSMWLEFFLPRDNPVVHYFYSTSENLFMLINSTELPSTVPTASLLPSRVEPGLGEPIQEDAPLSLLNIGPDSSKLVPHQVLMPHQGLTDQEYELITQELISFSSQKNLLCQWLYQERIVDYNRSCSSASWLNGHLSHRVYLGFSEPGFSTFYNQLIK